MRIDGVVVVERRRDISGCDIYLRNLMSVKSDCLGGDLRNNQNSVD